MNGHDRKRAAPDMKVYRSVLPTPGIAAARDFTAASGISPEDGEAAVQATGPPALAEGTPYGILEWRRA